jgi:hypothetical protein
VAAAAAVGGFGVGIDGTAAASGDPFSGRAASVEVSDFFAPFGRGPRDHHRVSVGAGATWTLGESIVLSVVVEEAASPPHVVVAVVVPVAARPAALAVGTSARRAAETKSAEIDAIMIAAIANMKDVVERRSCGAGASVAERLGNGARDGCSEKRGSG